MLVQGSRSAVNQPVRSPAPAVPALSSVALSRRSDLLNIQDRRKQAGRLGLHLIDIALFPAVRHQNSLSGCKFTVQAALSIDLIELHVIFRPCCGQVMN